MVWGVRIEGDQIVNRSDTRHGTENGYSNLGCRCRRCRAAHAEYHYAGLYDMRFRNSLGACRVRGCQRPVAKSHPAARRCYHHHPERDRIAEADRRNLARRKRRGTDEW